MPLRKRLPACLLAASLTAFATLAATGAQIPPPASPVPTAALAFNAATVGGPDSHAPAELFRPEGAGPFPAVVVLHPCNGVTAHTRNWARRLVSWGYVAMVVDSFGPRHVRTVCTRGRLVPPELRARDALAAADYLRSRPDVQPGRIGLIGFSHGGWTVLKTVLARDAGVTVTHPFAAAVAFYPGCQVPRSELLTDTLILIGDADDWTPASRCERWRDTVAKNDHTVELVMYPGALHAFDANNGPHAFAGHWIGGNPAAAEAAFTRTQAFFRQHLMAP